MGDGIAAEGSWCSGKAVWDWADRGRKRNAPARGVVRRVTNCFGQFVEDREIGVGGLLALASSRLNLSFFFPLRLALCLQFL